MVAVDRAIHLEKAEGLGQTAAGCGTCGQLQLCAENTLNSYFQNSMAQSIPVSVTIADPQPFVTAAANMITLNASWETPCFFCSLLGWNNFQITAASTVSIEQSQNIAWQRCPNEYALP